MKIARDQIQVDDYFEFLGSKKAEPASGTIVKVNRRTFDYADSAGEIHRGMIDDLIYPGKTSITREEMQYDVTSRKHRLKLLPEQQLQRDILCYLQRNGWVAKRVCSGGMRSGGANRLFQPAYWITGYGCGGHPDVVAYKGTADGVTCRTIMIEVKTPKRKNVRTEAQKRFFAYCKRKGLPVHLCTSVEEVAEIISRDASSTGDGGVRKEVNR